MEEEGERRGTTKYDGVDDKSKDGGGHTDVELMDDIVDCMDCIKGLYERIDKGLSTILERNDGRGWIYSVRTL